MPRTGKVKKLLRDQRFLLLLIFIGLNLVFGLTNGRFFRLFNYFNMFRQAAQIIIVASGATLLMMTGNFDLSTGSNVAFGGVLYALLASVYGLPMPLAALIVVICGMGFGIVNGTLVAKFNFPPSLPPWA